MCVCVSLCLFNVAFEGRFDRYICIRVPMSVFKYVCVCAQVCVIGEEVRVISVSLPVCPCLCFGQLEGRDPWEVRQL